MSSQNIPQQVVVFYKFDSWDVRSGYCPLLFFQNQYFIRLCCHLSVDLESAAHCLGRFDRSLWAALALLVLLKGTLFCSAKLLLLTDLPVQILHCKCTQSVSGHFARVSRVTRSLNQPQLVTIITVKTVCSKHYICARLRQFNYKYNFLFCSAKFALATCGPQLPSGVPVLAWQVCSSDLSRAHLAQSSILQGDLVGLN